LNKGLLKIKVFWDGTPCRPVYKCRRSFETSVIVHLSTRRNNPEDFNLIKTATRNSDFVLFDYWPNKGT